MEIYQPGNGSGDDRTGSRMLAAIVGSILPTSPFLLFWENTH